MPPYFLIYLFSKTTKNKKKNIYLWHLAKHDPQPENTEDNFKHLLIWLLFCCAKFEIDQTFEPTTPNIFLVPWSP